LTPILSRFVISHLQNLQRSVVGLAVARPGTIGAAGAIQGWPGVSRSLARPAAPAGICHCFARSRQTQLAPAVIIALAGGLTILAHGE